MVKLLLSVLLFFAVPTFVESYAINDAVYLVEIDEHTFKVLYRVDADIIAMAIDADLDSFLIGMENTNSSIMSIELAYDLIRAEDGNYAVLVNGVEVDYDVITGRDSSVLSFFVPDFTEEVEIIGTHVIPEFSLGLLAGLAALIFVAIIVSRTRLAPFRL